MAYPPEVCTQVEVAAACGMSVREIVEEFGVSKTTVHRWLNPRRQHSSLEACRRWRISNPEKAKACYHKWYYSNLEQARNFGKRSTKRWRAKNPEAARLKDRKNYERQYAKNPGYFIEKALRRQAKLQDLPMTRIEKMMCTNYYKLARELTEQTGIPHEVDHIWPLAKGGPHLPWNLQVLTAEENRKKRDKI
jgi:transposase